MNKLITHFTFIIFVSSFSWIMGTTDSPCKLDHPEPNQIKKISSERTPAHDSPIASFLTFQNNDAEEAMN